MAPAIGWTADEFLNAYRLNRQHSGGATLEDSVIAQYIVTASKTGWNGTATELLAYLNERAGERVMRMKSWPTSPAKLANDLRRIVPALRNEGVEVEFVRTAGSGSRRQIILREVVQQADATVATDATVSESCDDDATTKDNHATTEDNHASPHSRYESDDCDDCDDTPPNFSKGGAAPGPLVPEHVNHDIRARLVALGAEIGFPTIAGVLPRGHEAWAKAAQYFADAAIEETIAAVEAWMQTRVTVEVLT